MDVYDDNDWYCVRHFCVGCGLLDQDTFDIASTSNRNKNKNKNIKSVNIKNIK